MIDTLPFAAQVRTATMSLLNGTASAAGIKLQTYRGRPRDIKPPTAFIDLFRETWTDYTGVIYAAHNITVEAIVLFGLFDSGEAVDQRDRFMDSFYEYALPLYHVAGGNSTFAVTEAVDDPTYVPDWLQPSEQRTYFSTRISLEAFTRG